MKQPTKDGIKIEKISYLYDEQVKVFPIGMRLAQLLVIILVSYNSLSIPIYVLGLQINSGALNLSIIFFAIVIFLLFVTFQYDWIKAIGITIFYLFTLYKKIEQITNGFYILENHIIEKAGRYYDIPVWRYVADYSMAERDMTLLFIVIVIPLLMLYSVFIIRGGMRSLSFIAVFFPVVGTFALGMVPSEFQLIVFVLTILYFFKTARGSSKLVPSRIDSLMHKVSTRSAYVLCVLCIAVYFIFRLFVSPSDYQKMTMIPKVKSDIKTFVSNFNINDAKEPISEIRTRSGETRSVGGLNHGQLGEVDEIKFLSTNQLMIRIPENAIKEGLYLRGFVASEYKGRSWEGHKKNNQRVYISLLEEMVYDSFKLMNQTIEFLNNAHMFYTSNIQPNLMTFTKGTIEVKKMSGISEQMYAPYYSNYALKSHSLSWDLYASLKEDADEYELEFYYNTLLDDEVIKKIEDAQPLDHFRDIKNLYREFVYNTYTKLPDEGLDRIKDDFLEKNNELGISSLQDAIDYTKEYLHRRTRYDISPGKLPEGEDFVEYFIYENQIGYCSHYASAATIMLRAMGYPARYVEGYKVDLEMDENTVQINTLDKQLIKVYSNGRSEEREVPVIEIYAKDYNAHAWVEVYKDSYGWVPVEFTPGLYTEMISRTLNGDNMEEEDEIQVEETSPTPTEQPITPTTEPKEDNILGVDNFVEDSEGDQSKAEKLSKKILGWILPLFIILALVSLPIILMVAFKRWQMGIYKSLDNRNKALFIFNHMEKLFKIAGFLPRKERSLENNLEYVRDNCYYIDKTTFEEFVDTVKKARCSEAGIKRRVTWFKKVL